MATGEPRKADLKRWQGSIVRHLEDFPRQYAALEMAMAAFGDGFDLQRFKEAFDTKDDMEAYNHVQALERAVGRVQNFVAELAESAVKLTQLTRPRMRDDGSAAQQAFEALRDEGVIDKGLCRRLTQAQIARSKLEHSDVQIPAGDVHRTAELVHRAALEFIGPYRRWIEPYLT